MPGAIDSYAMNPDGTVSFSADGQPVVSLPASHPAAQEKIRNLQAMRSSLAPPGTEAGPSPGMPPTGAPGPVPTGAPPPMNLAALDAGQAAMARDVGPKFTTGAPAGQSMPGAGAPPPAMTPQLSPELDAAARISAMKGTPIPGVGASPPPLAALDAAYQRQGRDTGARPGQRDKSPADKAKDEADAKKKKLSDLIASGAGNIGATLASNPAPPVQLGTAAPGTFGSTLASLRGGG